MTITNIRIYFVTNRNPEPTKEHPEGFGIKPNSPSVSLRFGYLEFSYDPQNKKYTETYPDFSHGILYVAPEPDGNNVRGGTEIMEEVYQKMCGEDGHDTLFYVHGFDYTFMEAMQRAARIHHLYRTQGKILNIVVFTWPSDGKMLKYFRDRSDAKLSGDAIGRGLEMFATFLKKGLPRAMPCNHSVHLMAHSMGVYALRNAVQGIKPSGGRLMRIFDQALLLAADEDDDAFEVPYKLLPLVEMSQRVTVYSYYRDAALGISDGLKGNPDRLGVNGPRNIRSIPDKISVVQLGDGVFNDKYWVYKDVLNDTEHHRYDFNNLQVCKDVIQVMEGINSWEIASRKFIAEKACYSLE